jgi:hypothetical protein
VAINEKTALAGPSRPLGTPEIPQFHLPGASGKGVFAPRLYGSAQVQFSDRRRRIEATRRVAFLLPLDESTKTIDWDAAAPTKLTPSDLVKDSPGRGSGYLPLPPGAMEVKTFTRWAKQFDRWLARTQRVDATTKQDPPETVSIGPKRGGVSVELVAIVWELT